jgi:hypothetical protein
LDAAIVNDPAHAYAFRWRSTLRNLAFRRVESSSFFLV